MTIFILFSQQKTCGQVAGKQAWLHAAKIVLPSHCALHRALYSVTHSYLRAACLLTRSCTKKRALNNFNKCIKQRPKFHFCSNFFRKWQCLLHLTLYKDVYKEFVKHTLIGNSETKALVTIIALNGGKCQYFYYIGNFSVFNFEAFLQFFKPNNSKSNHGKSKLPLLSCRGYLALGTVFYFFT